MQGQVNSTLAGADAANSETTGSPRHASGRRFRIITWMLSGISVLFLTYVLGAAAIFFRFPSSEYLSKAFVGARAWMEKRDLSAQSTVPMKWLTGCGVDKPGKTFDGFTLYSCASLF